MNTKECASCGKLRRNQRTGWTPITRERQTETGPVTEIIGFTCPDCPTAREPIRRAVLKSGRVRFTVVVDIGSETKRRRQITRTVDTLDQARAEVERIRTEIAEKGALGPRGLTVSQLLERWLTTQLGHVREITMESKESSIKAVNRMIGDREVTGLKPADIRQLVADLIDHGGKPRDKAGTPRPLGASSVSKALGVLSSALALAVEDELIAKNPAAKVTAPKQTVRRGRRLEHWPTLGRREDAYNPQLEKFLQAADTDPWAVGWRLSAIGMRRSEVLALRWEDVDIAEGTVAITQGRVLLRDGSTQVGLPKGESEDGSSASYSRRVLDIDAELVELFASLREKQNRDRTAAGAGWAPGVPDEEGWSDLVLVDQIGVPIHPATFSDRFAELCRAAGVTPIHLHSLRHTVAFLFHARGEAPGDAAGWLGHSLQIHLGTYFPGSDSEGIRAAGRRALYDRKRRQQLQAV